MTAISGAFYSQFPVTGSLGLSLASIQGGTSTAANAAAINASAVSSEGGAFGILSSNQATTTTSPTIQALTTGQMTNGDHKVLASIGGTANDQLDIPWNANGTEPTEVTKLKQQGWIKLVKVDGTIIPEERPNSGSKKVTFTGSPALLMMMVGSRLGPTAKPREMYGPSPCWAV